MKSSPEPEDVAGKNLPSQSCRLCPTRCVPGTLPRGPKVPALASPALPSTPLYWQITNHSCQNRPFLAQHFRLCSPRLALLSPSKPHGPMSLIPVPLWGVYLHPRPLQINLSSCLPSLKPSGAGRFPASAVQLSSPVLRRQGEQHMAACRCRAARLPAPGEHHEVWEKAQTLFLGWETHSQMLAATHSALAFPKGLIQQDARHPSTVQIAGYRGVEQFGEWEGESKELYGGDFSLPRSSPPTSPGSPNPCELLAQGRCEQAGGVRPLLQST